MVRSSRPKAPGQHGADPPPEQAAGADRTWLLLLAPLLAVVASLTLSYLWNEDFWWYLTSGRQVLDQGGIPDRDPFLYTSGEGLAWVSHSWLWTVLVALVERFAGLGGVVVFHAAVACALVALVYTAGRADRLGLANALLAVLFVVTIADRLCGKADVATWLLLALFFHLFERQEAFTWRRGLALVVLQVLWANLHGGYPLGVFVALCYSLGGWLEERRASRRTGAPRAVAGRPPLWFPALLFLAAVADPRMLGERLAPFAFVLGSERFQPVGESGTLLILEWRSPFREGLAGRLPWLYLIAVAVGLAGFVAARRRRPARLLFFAGMAVLGATAVRHLPGLALAAAVVTLANLEERRRSAPAPRRKAGWKAAGRAASPTWRRWAPAAAAGLLAVVLLAAAVALRLARPGLEGEPSAGFFTVRPAIACPGAAGFVLEHDLPGPIFNDFQMGGYLGYRLYPRHRLFVDSRVLDPDLVVEYTQIVDSPAHWRRAEERWGFRTVILGNYSKTVRSPLGASLLRDPRWRLVYVDPLAVVLVKDAPAVPAVARVGLADAGGSDGARLPFVDRPELAPPLATLQRLFLTDFSANYLVEYLAVLGQVGRPRDVLDLATRAIEVTPGQPLLYRQRCAAHLVLGDTRAAVDDCEVAYAGRPEDSQVVALYAMALDGRGERQRALFLVERALREHRGDAALRGLLQRLRGTANEQSRRRH